MVGERLGVIIKGESKEIVDLRKNIVLVSLINRWSRWLGQNDIFEKRKSS